MRKGHTLVREKTGDVRGLDGLVRNLNAIPGMQGDMAQAWKKAEEVISYAVPPPWIPEGHVQVDVPSLPFSFFKRRMRVTIPSLLGGRGKPSLVRAADAFNAWAADIPVHFEIRKERLKDGRFSLAPDVKPSGPDGLALWMVWRCLFVEEWQRLRRCPQCRKWFVDTTRNKVMVRCSKSCTDKWWTLDRRRAQGHRSAKRRATK